MNVVSTCLFDDHARYQPYFPATLRAHHNIFRGWAYRVYHDGRIDSGPYARPLRALAERGLIDLVFITDDTMIEKWMLRRILPLWDDSVERFLMRDVDMVASYRERRAVEVWIRSGLAAHALSDKRGHHDWPMLDGMIGFRVVQARRLLDAGTPESNGSSLESFFARAKWPDRVWGSDYKQFGRDFHRVSKWTTNNLVFLADQIWPRVIQHACEHRLSGSKVYEAKLSCTSVDPFAGEDLGVALSIREGSDALIPFIGASMANSNIDLDAIVAFYRKHGDPAIESAISECEAA